MTDASQTLALLSEANKDGLLKLIYQDLAQPGVREVGKALQTVLSLGNNVLLPLRLLNETTRAFETRKFNQIANRFSSIPHDTLIDVSPEIGIPILESLSHTSDESLRTLFIELLASSADLARVDLVHPSFVKVIQNLSPDEGLILASIKDDQGIAFVSIEARTLGKDETTIVHDILLVPPDDVQLPHRMPLYIFNLVGLGLLEIRRNLFLLDPNKYGNIEVFFKEQFDLVKSSFSDDNYVEVEFNRHVAVLSPYGKSFIEACL